MKKLLFILLCPILLLTSCSKSNVTPESQSLEDIIVGIEWCLDNDNKDGFLLGEDGQFYITEKCQSNYSVGNWILEDSTIKYRYTSNSQEITTSFGEVTEYSESELKILTYIDYITTVASVYILDTNDIYGCIDSEATNFNPNASCDDSSCDYNWSNLTLNGSWIEDSVIDIYNDTTVYLDIHMWHFSDSLFSIDGGGHSSYLLSPPHLTLSGTIWNIIKHTPNQLHINNLTLEGLIRRDIYLSRAP